EDFGFEGWGSAPGGAPAGEEARQRHASLVTLLGIAERLEARPGGSGAEEEAADAVAGLALFLGEARGRVHRAPHHRARVREFDPVLLPRVEGGFFHNTAATETAELAQERPLPY